MVAHTGGNEKSRMMVHIPEALQSVLPMLTDRQKICTIETDAGSILDAAEDTKKFTVA